MTLDEIQAILSFSPEHRVCVEVALCEDFPGYVRTIELFEDLRVCVSFEVFGLDEGGAYFWAKYGSISDAIASLEEFTALSHLQWTGLPSERQFPELASELQKQLQDGHRLFQDAIVGRRVPLPPRNVFTLKGEYWAGLWGDEHRSQ